METTPEETTAWFAAGDLLLRTSNISDHRLPTCATFFRQIDARGTRRRILVAKMGCLEMTTWWRGPNTRIRALYLRPAWNWGLQYGASTITNNL